MRTPISLYAQNILSIYFQATPQEISTGKNWYVDAYMYLIHLHKMTKYKYSLAQLAYATSALSPRCSWTNNKRFIKELLLNIEPKCMKTSVEKAKRILSLPKETASVEFKAILGNGLKTQNFAINLMSNTEFVTVDTHAANCALGFIDNKQAKKIMSSPALYNQIADAYVEAGDLLGFSPCEIQAICWVVWRRLHNINV